MLANAPDTALSVTGLKVRDRSRGRTIVDDVSFEVAPGEIVSLVGPSGSGKSTTVLGIMGLLCSPLEVVGGSGRIGSVPVDFTDAAAIGELRGTGAAMIFQDPFASLNPVLRCGAQAEEPLRLHTELGRRERRTRVLELFSEVGFDDPLRIYNSLPSELSGGQLQRVMIAMATALDPALLLADEPTTALDPASERTVIGLLGRLRRERGMAVVMITHDAELATSVSNRVLAMGDGRLSVLGSPAQSPDITSTAIPQAPLLKPNGAGYLITACELTKIFGRRATPDGGIRGIRDVSLGIHRGEVVGVVGPSGSGKTTLGRCLAGLERPDKGTVQLEGATASVSHSIGSVAPVQLIYQSPYASLNPVMPVGEAVEEALRSRRVSRQERRNRALRLLAQVGLSADFYDRLPKALSGGERQRVVIARALAAEPHVLVADEPTASLDEHTATSILRLLKQLSYQSVLGVLLISHDRKAIVRIADRVMLMDDGSLGPAERIAHRNRPVNTQAVQANRDRS